MEEDESFTENNKYLIRKFLVLIENRCTLHPEVWGKFERRMMYTLKRILKQKIEIKNHEYIWHLTIQITQEAKKRNKKTQSLQAGH